jgi:hypothetical protein
MHAHVGMMLTLHGAKPIPEYDSSKEKHGGGGSLRGRMIGADLSVHATGVFIIAFRAISR